MARAKDVDFFIGTIMPQLLQSRDDEHERCAECRKAVGEFASVDGAEERGAGCALLGHWDLSAARKRFVLFLTLTIGRTIRISK